MPAPRRKSRVIAPRPNPGVNPYGKVSSGFRFRVRNAGDDMHHSGQLINNQSRRYLANKKVEEVRLEKQQQKAAARIQGLQRMSVARSRMDERRKELMLDAPEVDELGNKIAVPNRGGFIAKQEVRKMMGKAKHELRGLSKGLDEVSTMTKKIETVPAIAEDPEVAEQLSNTAKAFEIAVSRQEYTEGLLKTGMVGRPLESALSKFRTSVTQVGQQADLLPQLCLDSEVRRLKVAWQRIRRVAQSPVCTVGMSTKVNKAAKLPQLKKQVAMAQAKLLACGDMTMSDVDDDEVIDFETGMAKRDIFKYHPKIVYAVDLVTACEEAAQESVVAIDKQKELQFMEYNIQCMRNEELNCRLAFQHDASRRYKQRCHQHFVILCREWWQAGLQVKADLLAEQARLEEEKKEAKFKEKQRLMDEQSRSPFEAARYGASARRLVALIREEKQRLKFQEQRTWTINDPERDTGELLLHSASWRGHLHVVKHLVGAGADVNKQDGIVNKMTPLLLAVRAGHRSVVNYLIERGANLYAVDGSGDTALHWACRKNRTKVVVDLLRHKPATRGRRAGQKRHGRGHSPKSKKSTAVDRLEVAAFYDAFLMRRNNRGRLARGLTENKKIHTFIASVENEINRDCPWIASKQRKKVRHHLFAKFQRSVNRLKAYSKDRILRKKLSRSGTVMRDVAHAAGKKGRVLKGHNKEEVIVLDAEDMRAKH